MSMKLALQHPQEVDGIICMSGAPIDKSLTPNSQFKDHYKKIKAFYAHGTKDNVLKLSLGHLCKKLITNAGIQLEYHEYVMKHQIIQKEIEDISIWFKNHFLTK